MRSSDPGRVVLVRAVVGSRTAAVSRAAARGARMMPPGTDALGGDVSVLLLRGRLSGVMGSGHVQQDHGVVVGGAGFGDIDAQALAGGALQLHALEAEGDRADVGMVEGLLLRAVRVVTS